MNFFNEIPADVWKQVWIVIASSAIVASLLQGIKKWFSIGERKNVITFCLAILSALAAVADWIIVSVEGNPALFGQYTAAILGAAVLIHRYFLSSTGFISWLKDFNKDLHAVRAQRKEVIVPEDPTRPQFNL